MRAFRYSVLIFQKVNAFLNKAYFRSYVSTKGNIEIIGSFHLYVSRTSKMIVGRNFRLISSYLVNPLCTRSSQISIGDKAKVVIGENVGMSSPTIWIRKSLTIGDNVNIGGGEYNT